MRHYLIAMSFRTVSFPLAVWALLSGWTAVGVVLAAAATFLPQVAVTLANAIDHRTTGGGTPTSPMRALSVAPPSSDETDRTDRTDTTTDQDHDAHL